VKKTTIMAIIVVVVIFLTYTFITNKKVVPSSKTTSVTKVINEKAKGVDTKEKAVTFICNIPSLYNFLKDKSMFDFFIIAKLMVIRYDITKDDIVQELKLKPKCINEWMRVSDDDSVACGDCPYFGEKIIEYNAACGDCPYFGKRRSEYFVIYTDKSGKRNKIVSDDKYKICAEYIFKNCWLEKENETFINHYIEELYH